MKTHDEIPEYGAVTLTPKGRIVAGSKVTLKLRYMVGGAGIAVGGSLYICFPEDWEKPQAAKLSAPIWLPDSLTGGEAEILPYSPRNLGVDISTEGLGTIRLLSEGNWARLVVQHAPFQQGDGIVLIYGDTTWGGEGAAIGTAPRDDEVIRVFLDAKGDGNCVEVDGSPLKVEIVPGPAMQFNVCAPSIVSTEERFSLRLSVQDSCGNRPDEVFTGTVSGRPLFSKKAKRKRTRILFRQPFGAKDNNSKVVTGVRSGTTGAFKIAVTDDTGEIFGMSNPILSEEPPEEPEAETAEEKKEEKPAQEGEKQGETARVEVESAEEGAEEQPAEPEKPWQIFWGDINGKSGYSQGARKTSPDEFYTYAREMAGLDFAAITDYMAGFNEEIWEALQEAAKNHTKPDEFVAFPAFEWSSNMFGHRAVYFQGGGKIAVLDGGGNPDGMDIRHLYEQLRGKRALVVPLHTFVWMNWGFHDEELERLAEVYSQWGASERSGNPLWKHGEMPNGGIQQGLAFGYRLGMIANSDTHVGMPGRLCPELRPEMPFKGGLTAVVAKELTPEAIFDALWNRRCYATTGARIVLRFSLNGCMMGGEVQIPQSHQMEPRELKVLVAAADDIEALYVVRNNQDIYSLEDCGDFVDITYEDDEPLEEAIEDAMEREVGEGSIYYYIRVVQKNGEIAWSSPIWVTLVEEEPAAPAEEQPQPEEEQAEAEEQDEQPSNE